MWRDYCIAGNFRGSQISRFSRLTGDPRKLNPRNINPKRRSRNVDARDNRGCGLRSACRCLLNSRASSTQMCYFKLSSDSTKLPDPRCPNLLVYVVTMDHNLDDATLVPFQSSRSHQRSLSQLSEPRRACSKRRSLMDIGGGATLERSSAKIRSRNL